MVKLIIIVAKAILSEEYNSALVQPEKKKSANRAKF